MPLSSDVIDRARARVGMTLGGKYRLERLLGIGGMAAVYSAVHRNKKRVAIKILHPELSIDESVKTRFLREGYAANTVEHPGAVAVYDDDVTPDGSAFLVMELLEGETLDTRADRKGGTLPLAETLAIGDQLLDVLAAAHDKGLIHRDIKPDNLFLTAQGQLKVLDFGIARLRELTSSDLKETGVGSFMGTPAFMPPEQARGRWDEVDPRSDVWAVGATLFNLLSGRSVHETDSVAEQLVMAATVPAPPLISVLPNVQPNVAEVVDRALAYDKGLRWPDVRAMKMALRQAYAVIDPSGDLAVPKTSLPILGFDREGPTLAISDTVAHGQDSRPSAPARDSGGGSFPSALTSRTVSDATGAPQRRSRFLVFVGIAAVAAVVTVALWPSAKKEMAPPTEPVAAAEPAALAPPPKPPEPAPPVTHAEPVAPPGVVSPASAVPSAATARSPRAVRLPRAPVAPPPSSKPKPPAASAPAAPAAAAPASRKDDPLSKRY